MPADRHAALTTEPGCGLAIGRWPRFAYNAAGGGGQASLGSMQADGWQALRFDPAHLTIPDLSWRTTRVLGLPLPPGVRIALRPGRLEGRWQPGSGEVELTFEARFQFTLGFSLGGGALYRAPDLLVATRLGTAAVAGTRHRAVGQALDGQGRGLLVGVATVAPTGDGWLDRFLGLPDEALALLRCRLRLDGSSGHQG